MKISLKWLQDYVDIADYFAKPQELANMLTAAGLEVEEIHDLARQFENVVIGCILEKGVHPNADRLSLCQVSTGTGRVHQIVCGAQNHKKDDRVVAALPGAVLPGNFEIRLSKIRGVESGGMLCSEKELGLATESEGILILPPDAPIGKPFAEYMGFDDIIFEIKVTPNRADCLSHFGLAREIGALLGREAKLIELPPALQPSTSQASSASVEASASSTREKIKLNVLSTDLCPRYCGRMVEGVRVAATPTWMKKRLEAVGLKSINTIVDITNYIMLELGQPLHAFDVRSLQGGLINVETAHAGETFVTLDGTELKLSGEELTIRDGGRAVALAGIVGGENSGIQDDTTAVFIEAAYFTPTTVRRTAKKFGIETDSSYRFARGTNPEGVALAMNRAALFIKTMAGGEICGEPYDNYPHPMVAPEIEISVSTLTGRLGFTVEPGLFSEWMTRLGCRVQILGGIHPQSAGWKITPPLFRGDLQLDVDLVEEFARLHGYQHIPETLPTTGAAPSEHSQQYLFEKRLRGLLQGRGFLQAINYAFISSKWQERVLGRNEHWGALGFREISEPVSILNPLNEELNVMRMALAPGLLKNIVHNIRHGNTSGHLFELGFAHTAVKGQGYLQEARLGLAAWGSQVGLWQKTELAPLVYRLKAAVDCILTELQFARWEWVQPTGEKTLAAPRFLHPLQFAALNVEGKLVGFIGTLHPVLQDELKIREPVAFAEFNLDRLMQGQPRQPKAKPVSLFPAVDRDIALLMPKNLLASAIETVIRQNAGDLLQDVSVFDVFEGGTLPPGQRSVAFRLLFQDLKATLDDTRVNALRDEVVRVISEKFPVTVR